MTKIARKQGEHAPRSSEAKLARILAIAGDAIVSMDAQHRITLFNEAAEAQERWIALERDYLHRRYPGALRDENVVGR